LKNRRLLKQSVMEFIEFSKRLEFHNGGRSVPWKKTTLTSGGTVWGVDPIVRLGARMGAELGVERPSRNQQRLASLAARVSAVGDCVADKRFRRPVAAAHLLLIGLSLRGV
jgi:hypothetical protein